MTRLFIQSAKEEAGSGATGSGTNLSIPIICYRLLPTKQQGSPLPSSLFPLRRVASPHAVIKTTGGIHNAAWLFPACNRHHLVHKRVGGVLSPFPLPTPEAETSKLRIFDRTLACSRAKGNIIYCLVVCSATQSVKWNSESEHVSHYVS